MTRNTARAYAGDCRRAAAIAVHHGNRSVEGINAIVSEAKELNRGIELLGAVLDVLNHAANVILTFRGLLTLHATFRAVADNDENPLNPGAQYIVGQLDGDKERVIAILEAAKDGLGTHLILNMIALYEEVMPLMFTSFSLEAFQATAAELFNAENSTDE